MREKILSLNMNDTVAGKAFSMVFLFMMTAHSSPIGKLTITIALLLVQEIEATLSTDQIVLFEVCWAPRSCLYTCLYSLVPLYELYLLIFS